MNEIEPQVIQKLDNYYTTSTRTLKFYLRQNILQPGGFLKVRCQASILDLYNEASERIISTRDDHFYPYIHDHRIASSGTSFFAPGKLLLIL